MGVEPDIRFPSFGDPQEYGERSMDNALPWTSIDPARYEASGDLSQLVAVADDRYQGRIVVDEEFGWLMSDIDSYNERADEKSISLLESVGREKMKERKTRKRRARRPRMHGARCWLKSGTLVEPDPELGDFDEKRQHRMKTKRKRKKVPTCCCARRPGSLSTWWNWSQILNC